MILIVPINSTQVSNVCFVLKFVDFSVSDFEIADSVL